MTIDDPVVRHQGGENPPRISAEARDALYSQAMDLLGGVGAGQAEIDPAFSDDLRQLLEELGEIGEGDMVDLALPPDDLRRVMMGIRDRLPRPLEADRRSLRTRLVSRTCEEVLVQLEAGR
jgi:hypothetical protein